MRVTNAANLETQYGITFLANTDRQAVLAACCILNQIEIWGRSTTHPNTMDSMLWDYIINILIQNEQDWVLLFTINIESSFESQVNALKKTQEYFKNHGWETELSFLKMNNPLTTYFQYIKKNLSEQNSTRENCNSPSSKNIVEQSTAALQTTSPSVSSEKSTSAAPSEPPQVLVEQVNVQNPTERALKTKYGLVFTPYLKNAYPYAINIASKLLEHLENNTLKKINPKTFQDYRALMEKSAQCWIKILLCVYDKDGPYDKIEYKIKAVISFERYFHEQGLNEKSFLRMDNPLIKHYKEIKESLNSYSSPFISSKLRNGQILESESSMLMHMLDEEQIVTKNPELAKQALEKCDNYMLEKYRTKTSNYLPSTHPVMVRYQAINSALSPQVKNRMLNDWDTRKTTSTGNTSAKPHGKRYNLTTPSSAAFK